jgi:aminoglycoside 2''-phosphotransferase
MTDKTLDKYLNLIQQYYPDLQMNHARILDSSGQFNEVVCLDEKWIFRFPKTHHVAVEVAREVKILQGLQGKLPLPIPNPTYTAYHPESNQLEFMGYSMLAGEPLLRDKFATLTDETILEQIAEDMATFLKTLHQINPIDIGLDPTPNDSRQWWTNLYVDFQEQLFPHMRPAAQQEVTENFETALQDESLWQVKPMLIHGDFGTGNILYQDGHIVGVIDFTFCGVDDPAQDVGALVSSYGEAFAERVMTYYPDLRTSLRRARFFRSNYALIEALFGLRDNDPVAFESGINEYR